MQAVTRRAAIFSAKNLRQAMDLKEIIKPPVPPHTHTIVFLHGRGDNAKNFSTSLTWSRDSTGHTLLEHFPSFRWVFPEAELRTVASEWGNKWNQWFDVWNTKDFKDREELQTVGLKESVPSIRKILAREATLLGGRWDRVILAGISQGAATATHTLINLDPKIVTAANGQDVPPRLCAYLGFSCRMPFAGRSLEETRKVLSLDAVPDHQQLLQNTPILLEHCVDDPLVKIEHGKELCATLRGFGAQVEWKEYPNGGHWFNSPGGIDDAVMFLKNAIAGSVIEDPASQTVKVTPADDAMDMS